MHLHSRTKDEHIQRIQGFHGEGNAAKLDEALFEAFEDHHDSEDFRAWCAGFAFEAECPCVKELQTRFIKAHPMSLFPVKVDRASRLMSEGQIDLGANEARSYLAVMHEQGMGEIMKQSELIADGVARAFMLLTAVYTEIAARSYSSRLISYAANLPVPDYWVKQFGEEQNRLIDELTDDKLAAADKKWEAFFGSGEACEDLMVACQARGFDILGKRVGLLGDLFAEKPNFELDEEEFFQLIYKTEQGAFVLI